MTKYLLDADEFISAKRLHYGFEFCPAFWDWLIHANAAGKVYSVARVADELLGGEDDLAEWARQRGDAFFLPEDASTLAVLGQVAEWVNSRAEYTPAAKNTFFQVADYYLVSHALATDPPEVPCRYRHGCAPCLQTVSTWPECSARF